MCFNIGMEIERKWLIDVNNIPYDLNSLDHDDIEQAYINFSPTVRLRKIANKNKYILTMKSKGDDTDLVRQEYEMEISKKQYDDFINLKQGIILSKTRYKVKQNNLTLEIDIFHNDYEGLAYLEVEFDSIEQAKNYIPPEFVVKELTGLKGYSNAALVKRQIKKQQ